MKSAPAVTAETKLPAEPISPAPAPGRIAALDGLRAIAMLMVVVTHFYAIVPVPAGSSVHGFFHKLTSLGYSGVDLFFVLSGFLIGGILLDHRDSPRLLTAFYARRAFRILPVYLLLLVTFYLARQLPGFAFTNHGQYFFSRVPEWSYFLFVQNVAMAWLVNVGPYWLGASWSLAVEEQFYLVAPVFVRRASVRQIAWFAGLVIVLSPLVRLYALTSMKNPLAGVFLLATHADGLMWGLLCAGAARAAGVRAFLVGRRTLWATLIGLGAMFFLYASWQQWHPASAQMLGCGYSALASWFALIVLGLVLFPSARVTRILSWRPLAAIGITSYFSYLFHFPILLFLHWLFFRMPPQNSTWATGAVTALAVFATLAAAWASGRWFDGPLTRVGRRFSYA